MNSALPLILSVEPVTKETRSKPVSPHVAVVYADISGHVDYLPDRPLTRSEARRTYRTRYEVDLGDHRRKAQLENSPLPSHGDAYFFNSAVDVGFRVTDPEAVVRRNVADALTVVYGYLISAFWPVTRDYEIDEAPQAEQALNALFRQPVTLDEGITIYRCSVRLLPDRAAQEHLRTIRAANRSVEAGEAQHTADLATAYHQHQLAGLNQQARLDAETREHQAMAGRPIDVPGLIAAHLAKHPDQTDYALEMLSRHEQAQGAQQDINDKRSMDLLRYMMEQGLIQAVDIQFLRNQAVGRVQEITSPAPQQIAPPARPAELTAGTGSPAGSESWDDPLPGNSPAEVSLDRESPAAWHDAQALPAERTRMVPVYIIVDESPDDRGYFDALNRTIRTLPADLAAHTEVINAMRLAVVGYASDVDVRMPLNAVAAESFVPEFTQHPGSRLGIVFQYLRDRIAEDVDRSKSRGLAVGRPVIFLLCASTPADGPAWRTSYQDLTDRTGFPAAPNIVACGIGETDPGVIKAITSHPQSNGWVAEPDMPISEAAARYAVFVRRSIAALGRAHITGSSDAVWEAPDGFRPTGGPV
jgi:uncharacterized protein YegL